MQQNSPDHHPHPHHAHDPRPAQQHYSHPPPSPTCTDYDELDHAHPPRHHRIDNLLTSSPATDQLTSHQRPSSTYRYHPATYSPAGLGSLRGCRPMVSCSGVKSLNHSTIKLIGSMVLSLVLICSLKNSASLSIPIIPPFSDYDSDSPPSAQATTAALSTANVNLTESDSIERRILNAAPILGFYEQSHGPLADWMSNLPDQAPITRLSIPGTHDSATWNYTQPTQKALEPVTGQLPPAIAFQCQDRSLFQMLGDGIRFFDLRVGFLPDHQHLGFFHASALLSTTATVSDTFLGFYKWLDDHPTETILVSIKVDNATYNDPPSDGQPSSEKLQRILYDLLTRSDLARNHWLQEDSVLGTIGAARGKMIFIQRIDWKKIREDETLKPIGIALPPESFKDNDPDFEIVYNSNLGSKAFIEDLYQLLAGPSSIQNKVQLKLNAVDRHLKFASANLSSTSSDPSTDLFISFASGGALENIPPVTPKMLAIGTGSGASLDNSVNGQIRRMISEGTYDGLSAMEDQDQDIPTSNPDDDVSHHHNDDDQKSLFTDSKKKGRLGILIFDWYFQVPDLIQTLINQNFPS